MEAFWRKGFEATSLADLTRCTCLNKASLYRVFGDKHELFKAALKHYAESEFRAVGEVISETATPLENIRAVTRKIVADFAHDKGCMMNNSMVELAPHDPEVKAMLQKFGEIRLQALTGMILQAQQAGEIRSELEATDLARSLMIAFAGSSAMAKGLMSREQLTDNLEKLIDCWT